MVIVQSCITIVTLTFSAAVALDVVVALPFAVALAAGLVNANVDGLEYHVNIACSPTILHAVCI